MADKITVPEKRFGSGEVTMLDRLTEELSGPNRRIRQEAAHTIVEMAKADPAQFEAKADVIVPALVDALFRPEAQTRWESLDALAELAPNHAELVAGAFEGAEASLFDEDSARVRVSAFRLLARLAATSEAMSDKAWPLLDEAVQCFHGDTDYRRMLKALLEMARGNASVKTKAALAERMAFDAESGHGYVKTCSAEIVAAARGE